MIFKQNYKIFVGPVEISGLADGVVYCLGEAGCEAETVISVPHPFGYKEVTPRWIVKIWKIISAKRYSNANKNFIRKGFFVVLHVFWSWVVVLWAVFRFNVFIFLYGTTITNTRFELWLFKKLGYKIIFLGVGSDTRPPYIDGALLSDLDKDYLSLMRIVKLAKERKLRLKKQEYYANYWINSPASAHYHERSYIDWASVGVPKRVETRLSADIKLDSNIRILHSPSNAVVKGTDIITRAINNLKEKGYAIEFIKIQGMPNYHVIDELKKCDFVVDQVYSDAPMAALAIEAAFLGKPTIVGGYFSSWADKVFNNESLPPTFFVNPDNIEAAIERLIVDTEYRLDLGNKAREFTLKRWRPDLVGSNLLKLINNDVPSHWWNDPKSFCYVEGFGLPSEQIRDFVNSIVALNGIEVLQLADKPRFEEAFRIFKTYLNEN